MGLPHLGEVSFSRGVPPPSPWGLAPQWLGSCQFRLFQSSWWLAPFLPQAVFQGGHHIPNQFLCLFRPTQWDPGSPLEFVHLVVQIPNFFLAGLGSHCLGSGDICLWVQMWEAMSVASVDHAFCLLSPQMGCLEEHLLKN